MSKHKFVTVLISIPLLVASSLLMYYIIREQRKPVVTDKSDIILETINVAYKNKQDKSIDVRYKYLLKNEMSDRNLLESWDSSKPIFTLNENGFFVSQSFLREDKSIMIPNVSNSISLKPNEILESSYDVVISKDIEQFKDLIRFEVYIIVEELKGMRWTPVYQVIFMNRGPYWSLDKGPIERRVY